MRSRYRLIDVLLLIVLAAVIALCLDAWRADAQAPAANMCDINASEHVFRDCIARQASAALELRSEVVQLNNRLAAVEHRSVRAGISRDEVWRLANDAAYSTLCTYKVLSCR